MVYISSWQEFQEAAEALYEKSPNKVRNIIHPCTSLVIIFVQTRYCVKWRGSERRLVLKITDDTTVSYSTISI